MGFLDFFRRRRPEPVVDLSTPSARAAYADILAAKEADFQRERPVVDFSRPPAPPVIRRRGDGDPLPTYRLVRKVPPPPPPRPMCPDVID
ncbi:hypothetical protein GCM10010302_26500 [Streptomyces polychromogenes]|uniref:Uncharacterized protein n=1 Tax=Streptomyces polychromogenes TaxID=67342 RepID=A0ABN0VCA9_9ACTN